MIAQPPSYDLDTIVSYIMDSATMPHHRACVIQPPLHHHHYNYDYHPSQPPLRFTSNQRPLPAPTLTYTPLK